MKTKLVKTRKEHVCDSCKLIIEIGSNVDFISFKTAKYDKQDNQIDNQIGIEYCKFYICKSCIEKASEELSDL